MSRGKAEKATRTRGKSKPEIKPCRRPEEDPGDSKWPERLGLSADTALFWPVRTQVEDWYNNRRAQAGSTADDSLQTYAEKEGLSYNAALDAIGREFLEACLKALEASAGRGVLPPPWVRDVTLFAGQLHYEAVRKSMGTTVLAPPERLTSPIRWLGSKGKLAEFLVPLFPPHHTYVDVFAGGGSVLFAKKRSCAEVFNDKDARTINLMRVLQDANSFAEFRHTAEITHYARAFYYWALMDEVGLDAQGEPNVSKYPPFIRKWLKRMKPHERAKELDRARQDGLPGASSDVVRALRWLVINRMNMLALRESDWAFSKGKKMSEEAREKENAKEREAQRLGRYVVRTDKGLATPWAKAKSLLPAFHDRLQGVTVENLDWRDVLNIYDGPGPSTLIYLDPPYVTGSRHAPKGGTSYEHEMTDADHEDLAHRLLTLRAHTILSGYYNELYLPLEKAGWPRFDKRWRRSAGGKLKKPDGQDGSVKVAEDKDPIESIWVSPALKEWVSFLAPAGKWCEAKPGQPPPPVEELPK